MNITASPEPPRSFAMPPHPPTVTSRGLKPEQEIRARAAEIVYPVCADRAGSILNEIDALAVYLTDGTKPGTTMPSERAIVCAELAAKFRDIVLRSDHDPKLQRAYEMAARVCEEHVTAEASQRERDRDA